MNSMTGLKWVKFERKKSFKPVPGWNQICKEKHDIARHGFLRWKDEGMPREGNAFHEMKTSRADFRSALNFCRKNEDSLREAQIISAFRQKDFKTFWKNISVKSNIVSPSIDGKTKSDSVDIFREKFFDVLDDVRCQSKPENFDSKNRKISQEKPELFKIQFDELYEKIRILKPGIGNDNVHTNHLIYATFGCLSFIRELFNAIIQHGYFPKKMLQGEIRPCIKNRFGNKGDSNNYRPVMVSSHILKLFEYCIQPFLNNSLKLHDNQFGFRESTSTLMTVSVLKEIIQKYNGNGSTVFASFIDLSKGFDKVNHYKLIDMVWDTNLNNCLKKVLIEFLINQTAYISHDNLKSDIYKIGNGVRQGGVNSPLLFNFYLSFIVKELCNMKIGCKLALNYYPIISYADDLVVLAPSHSALQKMLNIIFKRFNELSLTINATKTKVVIFQRKTTRRGNTFYINNEPLEQVDNMKYLGVILKSDLNNKMDIERLGRAFLRQAFACLNKYSAYPVNVQTFLFKTYCTSFYGCQLWDNLKGCTSALDAVKVSFHKSVKRILGISFRSSSHQACVDAEFLTLNHILNYRKLSFAFQVKNSSSPCIKYIKNYLLRGSYWIKRLSLMADREYEIGNFMDLDQGTILARINFKFIREPRYQGYPGQNVNL